MSKVLTLACALALSGAAWAGDDESDATAESDPAPAPVAAAPKVTTPTDSSGRVVTEVDYRPASTRVEPRFKDSADARRLAKQGPLHCNVRVFVDAKGVPYEVRPNVDDTGCHDALWPAAEDAILKWRWAPVEVDGAASAAQFVVRLAQYR